MNVQPTIDPELAAEVLAHVAWARGAGGRWLPAAEPAPKVSSAPMPRAAAAGAPEGAAPGAGQADRSSTAQGRGAPGAGRRGESGAKRQEPSTPRAASADLVTSAKPKLVGLAAGERVARLKDLEGQIEACTRCLLAGCRTRPVPGEGSATARLVIVGEAPGAEEDRTGQPFVGAAGQLLTKMLKAIGLERSDVFILNLLKCRPPQNRTPRPDEVAACRPYLREQLEVLQPEVVLSLGSPASRELLRTERGITSLRGRFAKTPEGWRVMPSFHPAYLLRRPEAKRDAWSDLQKVARALRLELPKR